MAEMSCPAQHPHSPWSLLFPVALCTGRRGMGADEVPGDAVMSVGIQRGNLVMAVQAALQSTAFSLRKRCASTQLMPWMSSETPQPLLGCSAEMWLWVRSVPPHPHPPPSAHCLGAAAGSIPWTCSVNSGSSTVQLSEWWESLWGFKLLLFNFKDLKFFLFSQTLTMKTYRETSS